MLENRGFARFFVARGKWILQFADPRVSSPFPFSLLNMRNLTVAFASLALMALGTAGSYGRADYDIKAVSPAVVLTPQIAFQFGPQVPPPRSLQWLQVEVDFSSNIDWTDELTVKYYILLAGKCLTGEVTHIDIPKGRDLFSVMYVSPNTIARILNGHPMSGNDIMDVGVQLVKQGQVLVTKSFKTRGDTQWWQNQQQVTGQVLNKNQTPFAPILWDRYEQIKIAPTAQ